MFSYNKRVIRLGSLLTFAFIAVIGCQNVIKGERESEFNFKLTYGKIAFLAYTEGYWQVYVMNSDGTDQQQITKSDYDKSRVSWANGGQKLLVNTNLGELYIVDVYTHAEVAIDTKLSGMTDATISSDGQNIIFSLSTGDSVDANNIWIMKADGSGLKKVTNMKWLQHEPSWGPNGDWVYFLSGKGGQTHDIWRSSLTNRNVEQLTAGQLYHFDITVSSNEMLAYSSNRSGVYEIWTQPIYGKPKAITNSPGLDARPSWSPNGEHIVYESARGGVINIWMMSEDGGNAKQLTHNKVGARFPVWSQPTK